MRFTKLQREFIDSGCSKGSYVAFPISMLKGAAYKQWKKDRRAKLAESTRHFPQHRKGKMLKAAHRPLHKRWAKNLEGALLYVKFDEIRLCN